MNEEPVDKNPTDSPTDLSTALVLVGLYQRPEGLAGTRVRWRGGCARNQWDTSGPSANRRVRTSGCWYYPTARMLLSGSDHWVRFRQDGFELLPRARHTARVNHLLAGLHADDRALLVQALRIERPPPNHMLSSRADPATEIWFPHSGIIALTVTANEGRTVQAGVVGPEDCVGLETMLPRVPAVADAWVQITARCRSSPGRRCDWRWRHGPLSRRPRRGSCSSCPDGRVQPPP
jgi:hypothetical protein